MWRYSLLSSHCYPLVSLPDSKRQTRTGKKCVVQWAVQRLTQTRCRSRWNEKSPRKPGPRYYVHIRYINSIHSVRMELMGSKSRYYHCIYTHILCTSQYVVNTGISVSFLEVHFMYLWYVLFAKILTAYQYVLFWGIFTCTFYWFIPYICICTYFTQLRMQPIWA